MIFLSNLNLIIMVMLCSTFVFFWMQQFFEYIFVDYLSVLHNVHECIDVYMGVKVATDDTQVYGLQTIELVYMLPLNYLRYCVDDMLSI